MSLVRTAMIHKYSIRTQPSRTLYVRKGDIVKFKGCAIVNAANEFLEGGSGVDGAIHAAAGPELLEECRRFPQDPPGVRCKTGEAKVTRAYNLNLVKWVIHTVGPAYSASNKKACEKSLKNAYRSCLAAANEKNCETIAFPAISCGVYDYPMEEGAKVATSTCIESMGNLREVHFYCYNDATFTVYKKAMDSFVTNGTIVASDTTNTGTSETSGDVIIRINTDTEPTTSALNAEEVAQLPNDSAKVDYNGAITSVKAIYRRCCPWWPWK